MSIVQLDSENADRDITSSVLSLTDTPDASNPMLCQILIYLGDGVKDLDGTGGTFSVRVLVGSQVMINQTYVVTGGDTRVALWTESFPVVANTALTAYVLSPNAAEIPI